MSQQIPCSMFCWFRWASDKSDLLWALW